MTKDRDPGVSYLFQIKGMEDIFYVNRNNVSGKIGTSYTLDYDIDEKRPFLELNVVPDWAVHWCFLHVFEGDHYNR